MRTLHRAAVPAPSSTTAAPRGASATADERVDDDAPGDALAPLVRSLLASLSDPLVAADERARAAVGDSRARASGAALAAAADVWHMSTTRRPQGAAAALVTAAAAAAVTAAAAAAISPGPVVRADASAQQ